MPAKERTLSIIKPDATRRNKTGLINASSREKGLRIVGQKRLNLTREVAEKFYAVHKERPFFKDLVSFMSSGPVVVQVLEGPDAVALNRKIMGATNPANAEPGTIRKEFAESIEGELGPRLRQPREREKRNRLLLRRDGNCWLNSGQQCPDPHLHTRNQQRTRRF